MHPCRRGGVQRKTGRQTQTCWGGVSGRRLLSASKSYLFFRASFSFSLLYTMGDSAGARGGVGISTQLVMGSFPARRALSRLTVTRRQASTWACLGAQSHVLLCIHARLHSITQPRRVGFIARKQGPVGTTHTVCRRIQCNRPRVPRLLGKENEPDICRPSRGGKSGARLDPQYLSSAASVCVRS